VADDCPTVEALAAYVDHNLNATERSVIEAHLNRCLICRRTVALVLKSQITISDPAVSNPRDEDS
jgi:anti-sigma factor RsiW